MKYLTAEQIAKKAEHLDGLANKAMINRLYRAQDDSHLWPIRNEFNATERAIRQSRRFQRESGIFLVGLEYAHFLETRIGEIVNSI
jgi:hypothetical protein